MDQQVLKTGTYEPEITARLLAALRPSDVFWDVGANAGIHTVTVKANRPDVHVVAFEPSPTQFVRLRHNARINRIEVTPYCVALARERGYLPIYLQDNGNSGLNSLTTRPGISYSSSFPCWCDTGDDLLRQGTPEPNVMKIDVEGNEEDVLLGCSAILTRSALRAVVFESKHGRQPTLTNAGFTSRQIEENNWIAERPPA
jgi:FkbM family methyltransferase